MTGEKKFTLKGYSTWNDVMKNSKITDIQDPILEMEIDKHEFANMYKDIVDEIQGIDDTYESFIDYYFIVNPMKSYALSFRSEKEKNAFYDIGLNKKCVVSLTEVCEGETEKDKNKRTKQNKNHKKSKKKEKQLGNDDFVIFD
jgi:hypothetical protein